MSDDTSIPVHDVEDFAGRMERAPIGTPLPLRPAFDIRLQPDGYHIHGEVPGVTPQQLRLTFIDRRTLMIYGDFHREYDNPPEDFRPDWSINGDDTYLLSANDILSYMGISRGDEKNPEKRASEQSGTESRSQQEDEASDEDSPESAENSGDGESHDIYSKPYEPFSEGPGCETGDTAKWLLAERETGYFSRMFVLQKPIRKEGTQAALQNGILSVFLPLDPGPGNINSL